MTGDFHGFSYGIRSLSHLKVMIASSPERGDVSFHPPNPKLDHIGVQGLLGQVWCIPDKKLVVNGGTRKLSRASAPESG